MPMPFTQQEFFAALDDILAVLSPAQQSVLLEQMNRRWVDDNRLSMDIYNYLSQWYGDKLAQLCSTQAIIARVTQTGFEGVRHQCDGNPESLGKALWRLCQGKYRGQLEQMLAFLIDQHPAGWVSCWGDNACCRCHGQFAASALSMTEQTEYRPAQYVYAFGRTSTHQPFMRVLVKVRLLIANGERWEWVSCGIAFLNGSEPDWQQVQADAERLMSEAKSAPLKPE